MNQTHTLSVRYSLLIAAALLTAVTFSMLREANANELSVEEPVITGPGPVVSNHELVGPVGSIIDPEPAAPAVGTTIEAINFDDNNTLVGSLFIPPDPIGAAGPNHVVNVVNVAIEWYTKAGVRQNQQSLADFFAPLSPQTFTFDPKVIYDQYAGRFLVVSLERVNNGSNDPDNVSSIFVAVSVSSNPNDGWFFTSIDAKEVISSNDYWADYPGFAVGSNAVYITANMFPFNAGSFGGARLWIIDKGEIGGFYGGGLASVNRYDPPSAVGQSAVTMQPAHMFGTPPTGVGTFLVRYSGYSDVTNEYLSIIRVDDPLGSPIFSHQLVSLGDIDNTGVGMPDAPQSGTGTLIETNDRRALNAVWRNNSLWMATTIVNASSETSAYWVEMNTSTLASLIVVQQGEVDGEDIAPGTFTFFPSIAVDQDGNMGIGFAASAPSIFPGAYYTGWEVGDAPGTVQATETLAAGLDFYIRTFGGSRNRWGDYSGISLDPSDGMTFWVFNQYALSRGTVFGGEDGRWGTRFGSFTFEPPLSVTLDSISATGGEGNVVIEWVTGSECNNAGFNIWRAEGEGWKQGDYSLVTKRTVNPIPTTYGSCDSGDSYSYIDSDVESGVTYYYALEDVEFDGDRKFHSESIVSATVE